VYTEDPDELDVDIETVVSVDDKTGELFVATVVGT
jgi:hypothetical protein